MSSSLDLKLPADAQPTEVLANRFEAWRKVIKALSTYLKDYAGSQEDAVRTHTRLTSAINFPFEPPSGPTSSPSDDAVIFLPKGSDSISDVPVVLQNFHKTQAANASRTAKELLNRVIPRLEAVQTDLQSKIKEIKGLSPDFKNTVSKEQGATTSHLSAYSQAIDTISNKPSALTPKQDPYLLKGNLDKQLSRQVKEENFLLEAHLNIQASGKELETVVVQEIQAALSSFGKLTGMEAEPLQNLSNSILSGFPTKDPTLEWQNLLAKDPNFVDPTTKPRDVLELAYPGQSSNLASQIRSGYLERRSKYLKSYSKAWYVLTPTFLHEFKSPDRRRDPHPVLSLPIGDCQISHDKKGSSSSTNSHRFIINVKQPGAAPAKGQNWVFRAENKELLDAWFNDLTTLSQLDHPVERANKYFPAKEGDSTTQDPVPVVAETVPAPSDAVKDEEETAELSDSSEVTSLDEPFGAGDETEEEIVSPQAIVEEEDLRPGPPGRFPSEVALDGDGVALERRASTFVTPAEHGLTTDDSAVDDNDSVFSYDLKHETHSTLPEDKDFKPIGADIPVHVERKLTMTNHKDEDFEGGIGVARHPDDVIEDPKQAIQRRRSSVSTKAMPRRQSTLSRRATGSFGVDELKPLSSTTEQPGLFFAGGLPDTTSSGTS